MLGIDRPSMGQPLLSVSLGPETATKVLLGFVLIGILGGSGAAKAPSKFAGLIASLVLYIVSEVISAQTERNVMVPLVAVHWWQSAVCDVHCAPRRMTMDTQRVGQ
jgi:hypothetical protein